MPRLSAPLTVLPPRLPSRTPLYQAVRTRQHGFTLMEIMLALGIASAAAGAALYFSNVNDIQAAVHAEQEHITEIAAGVDRAWGQMGGFEGLNNQRLIDDGLAPRGMVRDGALRSVWNQPVTVQPEAIDGRANVALRIDYAQVPADACAKLAAGVIGAMTDIRVSGISVLSDRGEVDPSQVGRRCSATPAADMTFIYHAAAMGTLAVAPPLDMPCPPPQRRPMECPAGEFGQIREQRDADCDASGVWSGTWGDWAEIYNTCDPNIDCEALGTCPPLPAPPQTPCVAPPDQTRNAACPGPAGQSGTMEQTRSASCPNPTGAFVWGAWVTTNNTCAMVPGCPAPETQPAMCPTGQDGEREQRRDCIDAAGPTWTAWYDIENSCGVAAGPDAPPVGDPTPSVCTANAPQTRDTPCAAPQMGVISETRQSWCPAVYSTMPIWLEWQEVSRTCYDCPPDDTETRTVPQTVNCDAPQLGMREQTRDEQRTRDYTCPQAGGPAVANAWGDWTAATAWTDTGSNTCYDCPAPALEWTATSPGCPTGYVGTRSWEFEVRSDPTCPQSGPPVTWSAWTPTGNTRNLVDTCTAECTLPSPSTETNWTGTSSPCPAPQTGTMTWEFETRRDAVCSGPTGPATWGAWAPTGNTRNHADTCSGTAPAADCPVGSAWALGATGARPAPDCDCPAGHTLESDGFGGWICEIVAAPEPEPTPPDPTCSLVGQWVDKGPGHTCPTLGCVVEQPWIEPEWTCEGRAEGYVYSSYVDAWSHRYEFTCVSMCFDPPPPSSCPFAAGTIEYCCTCQNAAGWSQHMSDPTAGLQCGYIGGSYVFYECD